MSSSRVSPHVQHLIGEATLKFAFREFQQAIELLLEVVRMAPFLPHAYHTLGLIYEETGQMQKALKLFLMAAHLKRDVIQWKQLADLSKKHGEMEQCLYCLQRALALQPDDENAQWERARLLCEMGEHRRALKALLPLLRNRPGDSQIVQRLVRTYHSLGHAPKAIELLEGLLQPPAAATKRAAARAPDAAPPSSNADQLYSSGTPAPSAPAPAASAPAPAVSSPARALWSSAGAAQQQSSAEQDPAEGELSEEAGGAHGTPSHPMIDMHLLNMLLEMLLEMGKFPEMGRFLEISRFLEIVNSGTRADAGRWKCEIFLKCADF